MRGPAWKREGTSPSALSALTFLLHVTSPLIGRFRMVSLLQMFSQNWFEVDIIDSTLSFLQVLVCYITLQAQGKDILLFWRVCSFFF